MKLLKNIQALFYSFLFVIFLMSCDSNGASDSKATMQKARGNDGEIILVMGPEQWDGRLGEQIRSIFRGNVKGIPQDEPLYDLRRTDPSKLNSVLKASKNMMFVATLDDNSSEGRQLKKYFTDNSIEQIQKNPDIFSFNQQDVYAKGQEVLYLFGRTEEELVDNIEENRERVQHFFDKVEQDRMVRKIKKNPSKGIMNFLSTELGLDLVVPYGYDLAEKSEDYAWIRQLDQQEEYNIWAVKMPFNDESVFDAKNIKKLRNSLGKKYITDLDNDSLYLTTQDQMELVIDTVNLNGNFALRTKGLWKYSDNSRGGAFISYLFANEESGDLYYVEGYLDNPGKDKREPMRNLKAILSTADIPDTIKD